MNDTTLHASTQLVVIYGFEKCWTTSMANFLIDNGFCELLVPRIKESYISSQADFDGLSITPGAPVLDASQGYITNPMALNHLKPYDPKLILLYRDPYDRAYSAFRMYRLLLSGDTNRLKQSATLIRVIILAL